MSSDKKFESFMKASYGDIQVIQEAMKRVMEKNPENEVLSSSEILEEIYKIDLEIINKS